MRNGRSTARHNKESLLREVDLITQRFRGLCFKFLRMQEQERLRISRELHDEANEAMATIMTDLEVIRKSLHRVTSPLKPMVERVISKVGTTMETLQSIAYGLRPAMLDDLGLLPTLRWHINDYMKRAGITVTLKVIGMSRRIDRDIESSVYRIIQEALMNVQKHAGATSVMISLVRRRSLFSLSLVDDGQGFNVERTVSRLETGKGLGIITMRERAAILGGTFCISSTPGKGTEVTVTIPLRGVRGGRHE